MRNLLMFAALLSLACGDDGGGGNGGGNPIDGGGNGGGDGGGGGGGADAAPRVDGGNDTLSFFVTSEGTGSAGGNHGGLAGADATCQSLGTAAGAGGRLWRAYLSTSTVSARDRIGAGPWLNFAGEMVAADVTALHANGLQAAQSLTDLGTLVPGAEHDIMTGSNSDGNVIENGKTCEDWTSSSNNFDGWVGHVDGQPLEWSNVHASRCDPDGITANAGAGRLYCFAAD